MKTILLLFSLWDQINGSFCLWARSRALFGVCITQCVIHHKYANVVKSQRARAHQKFFEKHKSLLRKQCWFLHSVYFMSSLSLSLPLSHTHVIVFNRICHMWAVTRHTHTHTIAIAYPFRWSNWWRCDRQFVSLATVNAMQSWTRKWCRGTIQCAFDFFPLFVIFVFDALRPKLIDFSINKLNCELRSFICCRCAFQRNICKLISRDCAPSRSVFGTYVGCHFKWEERMHGRATVDERPGGILCDSCRVLYVIFVSHFMAGCCASCN